MPAVSPIVASTPAPAESAKVGAAPEISRASRPAAKAPDTAPTGERYNPTWSRKFLAGKSPLIPTYDSVPPLSSLHQDSVIFKITPHLAFFPVQGPGGRLGVHPLKKKGRMPNGGHGYLSGGVEIADFDVEPFGQRVAIAGEDGLIRLWSVGEDGVQGVGAEAEQVLKGDGIDKIATIAFHPTAKDLLTALTNEQGSCAVRFFDLAQGQEVKRCPLDLDGAFNMAWSPQGDKVAIATKDGRLMVLDPRRQDSQAVGKAHDSPRSFQITWIDDTHLLSVGFSRGSQRRINLYSIDQGSSGQIETTSSFLMDISPSVLFPHYDPDTSILYVWGKGERQIQAFEIRPEDKNEPIAKLPSFTSGSPQLGVSFFPKRMVDIKKVEVARVLRLTAKSIEEVGFSIPRNKPDFFQDDIYVDTLDTEHHSTTAQEWLGGARSDVQYLSLKLDGMTLRKSTQYRTPWTNH
jgi:WD40 repeat protein